MRNETRDYRDHQKRNLCGKENTVSPGLACARADPRDRFTILLDGKQDHPVIHETVINFEKRRTDNG